MTLLETLQRLTRKMYISGVRLRCPHCEQGRMFNGLFDMQATCPVCSVRFERRDGESVGGMMFTMAIIPTVALAGFFLVDWLTAVSVLYNGAFWLAFIVGGVTLIYRHSRAAWVAVNYVTGGVYADPPQPNTDAQREQIVSASRRARSENPPHS